MVYLLQNLQNLLDYILIRIQTLMLFICMMKLLHEHNALGLFIAKMSYEHIRNVMYLTRNMS